MKELYASLVLSTGLCAIAAAAATNDFLPTIPPGYYLHAYDDCGVEDRQPHVLMQDCYLWTFGTSDTDAGPRERSAVFSYKGIQAVYTNLEPALSYVLALTYASDHVYNRVQSLEADGVVLHGPYPLAKAVSSRVIVAVPQSVTRDGKMTLSWKIHGEVNATVSIIELWASAPSKGALRVSSVLGLPASVEGQVLDLSYASVSNAQVTLSSLGRAGMLSTNSDAEGLFGFSRQAVESMSGGGELVLTARHGEQEGSVTLNTTNLFFDPVHYRPLPQKSAELSKNSLLLDGTWLLDPTPAAGVRTQTLLSPGWKAFRVPSQWLQQGFDLPQDKPVAMAKEFLIPKQWAGSRVILRFDSIHAGTRYWLNGRELGYSENLFTPVEWDITEAARPGQSNRLDLEMKVATVSEGLSHSSGYAFHNLGGIDRSVRVFALPPIHVRHMQVNAGLDANYRDGELALQLGLDSGGTPASDLSIAVELRDPSGKRTRHSLPIRRLEPFTGTRRVDLVARVANPLQWSAEKPNLYRLVLEVRQGKAVLERIERNIGFRKVEIRGRQFYVNGRRIKLAGACRHETDPLTGRANTMRHAETDVRLMKEANLNLIRTSHYPPPTELLEAADRVGMYVEVEAPFCWVGPSLESAALFAILGPTSAMVDYHHTHPSVIFWSLANESHFNPQFRASAHLCKELDPTRPTTFNHDFASSPSAKALTGIANLHYPGWPFESVLADDPRPLYFGEYSFPVCHEQTDVSINPGLRELWGQGSAEPESEFSRACAGDIEKPPMKPGLKPGAWSSIVKSEHLIGGSIWASHDDAFYFSETNHAGYAWVHGFWGLIDGWRRPKPEWWMARHLFSPVWLETRHVSFVPGQTSIRIPIENRYAFTDLSELRFNSEINGHRGRPKAQLAPGARGALTIPLPRGTLEGDRVLLRVTTSSGMVINESAILLGKEQRAALPVPATGAPERADEGDKVVLRGNGFGIVFDRTKGDFDSADPRHTCAVVSFPSVHVTRYDFGDLNGPNSPPYAVFPDSKTRRVERVEVKEESSGLRLTVHDRYENFAGSTSWLLDKHGRGTISCDYVYSGKPMDTREGGMRVLLKSGSEELQWRRWSEWGVFPEESISRTKGSAKAHRDPKLGPARWNQRPSWPWSLDETELGTADFRSIKYNIYQAALVSPSGSGITAHASANAHIRAALAPTGVAAHLLWGCPLGQVTLNPNDHLKGEFVMQLRSR